MGGPFIPWYLCFLRLFVIVKSFLSLSYLSIRDHAQNTTNFAISLVANNVILPLIGSLTGTPITLIMYHASEGTRPCLFHVTEKGHGRVTEPEGDHKWP